VEVEAPRERAVCLMEDRDVGGVEFGFDGMELIE
jgi:hypothetical protein